MTDTATRLDADSLVMRRSCALHDCMRAGIYFLRHAQAAVAVELARKIAKNMKSENDATWTGAYEILAIDAGVSRTTAIGVVRVLLDRHWIERISAPKEQRPDGTWTQECSTFKANSGVMMKLIKIVRGGGVETDEITGGQKSDHTGYITSFNNIYNTPTSPTQAETTKSDRSIRSYGPERSKIPPQQSSYPVNQDQPTDIPNVQSNSANTSISRKDSNCSGRGQRRFSRPITPLPVENAELTELVKTGLSTFGVKPADDRQGLLDQVYDLSKTVCYEPESHRSKEFADTTKRWLPWRGLWAAAALLTVAIKHKTHTFQATDGQESKIIQNPLGYFARYALYPGDTDAILASMQKTITKHAECQKIGQKTLKAKVFSEEQAVSFELYAATDWVSSLSNSEYRSLLKSAGVKTLSNAPGILLKAWENAGKPLTRRVRNNKHDW